MSSQLLDVHPRAHASVSHCRFAAQKIQSLDCQGDSSTDPSWVEILIRPAGPSRHLSPLDFVTAMYQRAEFSLVDTQVLQRVVDWQLCQRPMRVSVNIHPDSMTNPRFLDTLLSSNEEVVKHGHSICVELIEYGETDDRDGLINAARAVRKEGVLIALDDFGRRVNCFDLCAAGVVDYIKIDAEVIDQLHENSNKQAVARSIVTLAEGLGGEVIAEGVESPAQAKMLQDMNVRFAQGYFFHRPEITEI